MGITGYIEDMNKIKVILLLIISMGCNHQKTEQIPERIQNLGNLTIYSSNTAPERTISFQKDIIYGETVNILIGRIGDVAVDDLRRVYISDLRKMVIHVYDADGRYITELGGKGGGPEEFSLIKSLQIRQNQLFAFDPDRHRVNKFNIDTLTSNEAIMLAGNRREFKELYGAFPLIHNLIARDNDTYIAEFVMHPLENLQKYQNVEVTSYYHLLDSNGTIIGKLFDFISEIRSNIILVAHIEPFFGRVKSVFSSEDSIYLADPGDFLVKTYGPDGGYQNAFYYPIQKIPLTRESAIKARVPDRYIDRMELLDLPEAWPVLTEMVIDDQDRLWISTTVEDMNVYEWWVLEKSGELITRFYWPRNEPIELVKNGYMYTRQTDEENGLQQVVRYRVEFQEI